MDGRHSAHQALRGENGKGLNVFKKWQQEDLDSDRNFLFDDSVNFSIIVELLCIWSCSISMFTYGKHGERQVSFYDLSHKCMEIFNCFKI